MTEIIISYIEREFLPVTQKVKSVDEELLINGTINSMGLMRLVRFIEKRFQVQIPFEDITADNFNTVKSISSYLAEKRKVS